ncbi:NHL domain-containing protein [Thalassoglobus polymorphus]|uniref:Serine/threonine-protein kinase PknD n=1 Tax=Thalassoglobus polymorphus TaxID=2527994 RepID=A0A517QUY1_9PLAN|nr:hypothetical protein [Thalassoglobus polymorphus]QDT35449.1 Serine/threonine-protein kinase PknD [Thalassoglobus polymorphus]
MFRLFLGVLFSVGFAALSLAAQPVVSNVEFVVGDLLKVEGGSATPSSFPFNRPFGIDFDSAGMMYVVELEGGRIFRLGQDHTPVQISGDGSRSYKGDGGKIAKATYNGMHNLAIDSKDRAYIADSFNHCLREIDLKAGTIRTLAGNGKAGFSGDGKGGEDAQFDYLMCVSLNPAGDALFIADLKNSRIRKIDLKTGLTSTVAGNGKRGVPKDGAKATESPLVDPRAVAVDSKDNIYILERGGHALRKVDSQGRIETVAGTGEKGFKDGAALESQLASPKHICIDAEDRVIIADDANAAIRCYDPKTKTVSTLLGRGFGKKELKLNQPHGVTIQDGTLYVCDTSNNRIFKVSFAAE